MKKIALKDLKYVKFPKGMNPIRIFKDKGQHPYIKVRVVAESFPCDSEGNEVEIINE